MRKTQVSPRARYGLGWNKVSRIIGTAWIFQSSASRRMALLVVLAIIWSAADATRPQKGSIKTLIRKRACSVFTATSDSGWIWWRRTPRLWALDVQPASASAMMAGSSFVIGLFMGVVKFDFYFEIPLSEFSPAHERGKWRIQATQEP